MKKPKEFHKKSAEAIKQEEKDKAENLNSQYQLSNDMKSDVIETIKQMRRESVASRAKFMSIREECVDQYEGVKVASSEPWEGHCFSRDTDILTKRGWVNIVDLREDDMVYSMNPQNRETYWMPVVKLIRHYHEKMIHFKGKSIDLLVSPEHKMLVQTKTSKGMFFREARQIHKSGAGLYVPLTSNFKNHTDLTEIYNFKASDWMEFLGWYLSEGHTYKSGTIGISQDRKANPKKCKDIENLLNRMGLAWSYSGNKQYLVSCKDLVKDAREELKSSGVALTKRIPRKRLEHNPELLSFMFESMMKGDGNVRKRGGALARAYYTASKGLADDFQELLQKMGLRGRISKRVTKGRFKINGKDTSRSDVYAIEICNKDKVQCAKLESKEVMYDDYAFCLTTPFHTVYVRRNGVAAWSGNSNISTMITTVASDLLHSKLFPMVWNETSITWQGREENDGEISEVNKIVMGWATTVDMKLRDKVDDIVHLLVVDGTVAIKLRWVPYWKWITRKVPKVTPSAIITGQLEYDIKYEYIRDERCELDIRPLERVHIPYYSNSTDPRWEDGAEYILDDRWYTLAELREMQLDGVIDEKINLDDLLGKMDEMEEFKGTQQRRMEAEGVDVPMQVRKESFKLHCVEGYIKYDVTGDKRREQCVFLVVMNPAMYLSGKPLHTVSRIGRRPWIIRPFLRRPGRAYGKSVPELVRHLHNELDAIHNQRIDAGNMAISPPFFYRPASGKSPRRIKAGPATGIPLDDPQRDIYYPTFNTSGLAWSANEERLVMELIERLTYLTPAMLGRESASRPTARGTLAVIQQGEGKFGLIGGRVQNIICELLTDIRQKYEENMPPVKWERIMGKKRLREWPSPEYMAGMYEANMQLDLTSLDAEAERTIAVMMYQYMGFDPLVQQNPAFMWQIRSDVLKAYRRVPVENYIGPKPPVQGANEAEKIFTKIEGETKPNLLGVDPTQVLPKLAELKQSERYDKFTPEAKQMCQEVMRELQIAYMENVQRAMAAHGQVSTKQGLPGGADQPSGLGGLNLQGAGAAGGGGAPQGGAGQPNAVSATV